MVSGFSLFFSLFNNIAIFIALITLYSYIYSIIEKLGRFKKQLLTGVSFGFFAVGCMYAKIPVFEGVIVDQRNAIITLSAAFGGPLSGLISAVMAGAFRAYLGGNGVLGGIIGVHLAAAAGTLMFFLKDSFSKISTAIFRSLVSVVIILPGFLFIGDFRAGFGLMMDMSIPYGTAIFVGILCGGLLIKRQELRSDIKKILRVSEEKYRVLFESFPLGITITSPQGKILETNSIAEKLLGISTQEHSQKSLYDADWRLLDRNGQVLAPDEYPGSVALRENRKVEDAEIGYMRPDGSETWLSVTATPIPLPEYGAAIVYQDVSTRKQFETNLELSIEEKDLLIQELYHRTKNNMQMMIALLELQNDRLNDEGYKDFLTETQNRIHAMALVHEKLYQSGDLLNINLTEYIRDLVALLEYSYHQNRRNIITEYNLEDVYIKIDAAVPFGLVLQELISNVFKHAFREGQGGHLLIRLSESVDNIVNITVADDGCGLPKSADFRVSEKFGLSTAVAIVEEQLKGSIKFNSRNGLECSISFRNKYSKTKQLV